MALFKVLRGPADTIKPESLTKPPFVDGYAYFTPDDGNFYIDVHLTETPAHYYDRQDQSNSDTIYRIEVESGTMAELYSVLDNKAVIGHKHTIPEIGGTRTKELALILEEGTGSFVDAGTTVNIDIRADWNETDQTKAGYIKNKPTITNIGIVMGDGVSDKTMYIQDPILNGDGVSY